MKIIATLNKKDTVPLSTDYVLTHAGVYRILGQPDHHQRIITVKHSSSDTNFVSLFFDTKKNIVEPTWADCWLNYKFVETDENVELIIS